MTLVPVTLLTGFLGSGKSTLLNDILREPEFANAAVIVNEFGEIGLDGLLVEHSSEQLVTMTTGCLCCTISGDIRETLLDLYERRRHAEIPPFQRVIVETTGLADPAPIVHTLMQDERLDTRYSLGGIVATIDVMNVEGTLERHFESVKQVAMADRLVLTKTDMLASGVRRAVLDDIATRLARINPGAKILDRHARRFSYRRMFDTMLFDPTTKTPDVRKWLNLESFDGPDRGETHDHDHEDHGHEHLDVNRHDDSIRAYCVTIDEPFAMMTFVAALEHLIARHGSNLIRMKGIIWVTERPDTPLVLHGVQHVVHPPVWLDKWPDGERGTKLVFITRDVSSEEISTLLSAYRRAGATKPVRHNIAEVPA